MLMSGGVSCKLILSVDLMSASLLHSVTLQHGCVSCYRGLAKLFLGTKPGFHCSDLGHSGTYDKYKCGFLHNHETLAKTCT